MEGAIPLNGAYCASRKIDRSSGNRAPISRGTGRSPVGQRIRLGEGGPWVTIVGVVGDILQSVMDREPRSVVYLPYL